MLKRANTDPKAHFVPQHWFFGRSFDPISGCGPKSLFIASGSFQNYLIPTTIESGPQSDSTRVSLNPASSIQRLQSAPV